MLYVLYLLNGLQVNSCMILSLLDLQNSPLNGYLLRKTATHGWRAFRALVSTHQLSSSCHSLQVLHRVDQRVMQMERTMAEQRSTVMLDNKI